LLTYPSFQLVEGLDDAGPALLQLPHEPSSNLGTKHDHRFAGGIEITVMQKPLNLSRFLTTFATSNLDDGRLKFYINFADETSLNSNFLLKSPQAPAQPTGDSTLQSHCGIAGLGGSPYASEKLKSILPMFRHPNPLLFNTASRLALCVIRVNRDVGSVPVEPRLSINPVSFVGGPFFLRPSVNPESPV